MPECAKAHLYSNLEFQFFPERTPGSSAFREEKEGGEGKGLHWGEGTSVFTIGSLGPCPPEPAKKSCIGQKCKLLCTNVPKASASEGLRAPDPPPEFCPWTILGTSDPPAPLAALSGNESLCFSLRLCFSNDVCSALKSCRRTRNQRHGLMAG